MNLAVQKRDVFGKKTQSLRGRGLIPAELYGREVDNLHLSVVGKDFKKALSEAGESSMFNLEFDGEKRPVLIYNVARHPVSGEILNIDFYQVKMDEAVVTDVPIEFLGESPAVEDKDGVLVKVMQEVEIEALPADIPRKIEVDLSRITDVDQSIYIKDLIIGKGVKIMADPESVVVTVKPKMTEDEAKALEQAATTADVSKIEVEGAKKEEEVAQEEEK